jgi:hypothetical protein
MALMSQLFELAMPVGLNGGRLLALPLEFEQKAKTERTEDDYIIIALCSVRSFSLQENPNSLAGQIF